MKKKNLTILMLFLMVSIACKNERKFSAGKHLSEYKKTTFIPTLEHEISPNKNAIYCATLLFAWDEIRKKIHSPLEISKEDVDLDLLNNSKSFLNVLNKNEYLVSGEVNTDGSISARAEFSKSLPFDVKLERFQNKLVFEGKKVASFGIDGYSSREQRKIVKILYYKNDNNFIIKLFPKDKAHEIILFKTANRYHSIAGMVAEIKKLTAIGNKEAKDDKKSWKYYCAAEDEIVIPKFNFNIETNYTTLENKTFKHGTGSHTIDRAWQRTAFMLDELGAEIESEGEAEIFATEEAKEQEKPKPKKMIFDKPFLILLKRVDAQNPYFGLWTVNPALMVPE